MWRLGEGMDLAVVRPAAGGFARHSHDEYVVSVNVRGSEQVRLDRATFEVGTDEVTIYNPGQVQACTSSVPDGRPWTCVSLYLRPEAVASWTGGRLVDMARPWVRAPRLRAELLETARAVSGAEPDSALLAERMTVLFLALVERTGTRTTPGPGPADERVRVVLDRLRADLATPARVDALASHVGLSREQLIRSFTRAVGCPPYAWQLQARLAEGRRRLRQGQPIADVAHGLGFADQAHFSKHFRAAYATAPGRYRAAATAREPAPALPRASTSDKTTSSRT